MRKRFPRRRRSRQFITLKKREPQWYRRYQVIRYHRFRVFEISVFGEKEHSLQNASKISKSPEGKWQETHDTLSSGHAFFVRMKALVVRLPQRVPEDKRENSVRTESKVHRGSAFVKSEKALLHHDLVKGVSNALVVESGAHGVDRLVVDARREDVKRRHEGGDRHPRNHAGEKSVEKWTQRKALQGVESARWHQEEAEDDWRFTTAEVELKVLYWLTQSTIIDK